MTGIAKIVYYVSCVLFAVYGVLNLLSGVSDSHKVYLFADLVVRVLGVAFLIFSIALLLRRMQWALTGIIVVTVLSVLEYFATVDSGQILSDPSFLQVALLHFLASAIYLLPCALLAASFLHLRRLDRNLEQVAAGNGG